MVDVRGGESFRSLENNEGIWPVLTPRFAWLREQQPLPELDEQWWIRGADGDRRNDDEDVAHRSEP